MDRAGKLAEIRGSLSSGRVSLGSWIQFRDGSTAEIMGAAGYDWVAVDMEHGSISVGDLPDIFRALELGEHSRSFGSLRGRVVRLVRLLTPELPG